MTLILRLALLVALVWATHILIIAFGLKVMIALVVLSAALVVNSLL